MTNKAIGIVENYIKETKGIKDKVFDVYIVWQCYILGNYKWLISSTLPDGEYYEITYCRDTKEFYFDIYSKTKNIVVKNA